MMNSREIRQTFFEFFSKKQHKIVGSAPMVIKGDPSLMFTNAGMNQFKDIFLGNTAADHNRIANSQKCLRVSGKHNDLEEVGHDTFHHTMFEMLGNWSFGDYFKKEAIEWSWEFLTSELGISPDRIYVTVFEGAKAENLERDSEAAECWERCIPDPQSRILEGSKKNNFWEMGDTGPCGPCSEIHIDLRDDSERSGIAGHELVNKDHPQVIEIWNLVFIQFNRKSDGTLEPLPQKHVDTGMGFERLCMVIQKKRSNYDTDIFQPLIKEIAAITDKEYGKKETWDISMRVVADHVRAVSFSIADGQLPSNNKAGYVIRRILRRAIRYGYTFLEMNEPFIYRLVPVLTLTLGDTFDELTTQQEQISKVIFQEETAFLNTLGRGIKLIEKRISEMEKDQANIFPGKDAFILYDTYGFPLDLTQLILKENNIEMDFPGFDRAMQEQRSRSRKDAEKETDDWVILSESNKTVFTGYEKTEDKVKIIRYRKVKSKGKELYHLVFNVTPFYSEAGGQIGDSGYLTDGKQRIRIIDTIRENNLIIHITDRIPDPVESEFKATVDSERRRLITYNHSATHLLHNALQSVLGNHVEQKGSLVTPEKLRFDFSHFQKISLAELREIENIVNGMIRRNIYRKVEDNLSMKEALDMGAVALFGEKYGDRVRVVSFGDSIELCGGTHAESSSGIGLFKITSEGAIAAGIRRIEAITSSAAFNFVDEKLEIIDKLSDILKGAPDIPEAVTKLFEENNKLTRKIERLESEISAKIKNELLARSEIINNIRFVSGQVKVETPDILKSIASQVRSTGETILLVAGAEINGRAHLVIMISDDLIKNYRLDAGKMIRDLALEIDGAGGGQPFLATAGGKNPEGIRKALQKVKNLIGSLKES